MKEQTQVTVPNKVAVSVPDNAKFQAKRKVRERKHSSLQKHETGLMEKSIKRKK